MELPEFVPERVAALDPLGADEVCARLPALNAVKDVGAMTRALAGLLPAHPVLSGFSYDESLAAMRDLGMLLGSLKRHGVEPVRAVPGLEPVLIELGRRTDMVPRNTVHHFVEMNPRGARERLFTGDPMESLALETVRVPLRHIAAALPLADRLSRLDSREPEFPLLLNELADELGSFDAAMNLAQERLDPAFFFGEFLPYTDGIEVAGEVYGGPAASHVPLGVLDLLVWESDHPGADPDDYRRSVLRYTMPQWRNRAAHWAGLPSLATRIATGPTPAATAALTRALRALVAFRGKHLSFARKGIFDERIALLRGILDRTRQMAAVSGH